MKQSNFLRISGQDIKKAIIMGAGVLVAGETASPIINEVSTAIGEVPQEATHGNTIAYAVVTMLVYVLKNWLTNSSGKMLDKEPKQSL